MNILINIITNQITIPIILLILLSISYFLDTNKDSNKDSNEKSILLKIKKTLKTINSINNFWPIIIVTSLNFLLIKYFLSSFNIEQLTKIINPITVILSLSIVNISIALYIIQKDGYIISLINKNKFITSVITSLLTTLFYIIKPILISTYYSAIDRATSELTLNSIQQYPIFRDLFFPITIEALYFITSIAISFEITIFIISCKKEINDKKNFYLTLLTLFFIFLFSASHIFYLTKMLTEKTLTNQSIGYLIIRYEYSSLSEKCNNPKLIELSKTNRYWFKFISHNKIIYAEGIWDPNIKKEERKLENLTKYNFYPFEEHCINKNHSN